ncbi:hypothetical protein [Candidatus Viridilinea mediisalina]|uniref:DUF2357 domain-containing protein n=1 Tax=Candidatus Viridilinea mediisalina TaxID=2024553 RepID=A0A2A6RGA9_9CHLR|nr:hypothetical protein [Candidatus Viridilinea mediisalina]PDW01915.1 hypothetical protein CJ255_16610 [Candidatus Viridilinea mediisalina]
MDNDQRTTLAQRLQRRVMRLLLLHDQRLFRGQFRTFYTGSEIARSFADYDRFLQVRMLSDELLGDIMPRIRRQLSLQADQARLVEAAPTRGEIDWPRTMQRGWQEHPELPPLTFVTRLRQRSAITPENLFTVALLLDYQNQMKKLRSTLLADAPFTTEEEQLLSAHAEQVERELAAAYARALLEEAQHSDVDALAQQVAARLRPGPNPYRDLCAWWERFSRFKVGRGTARRGPTLAPMRHDEKADAWLYELWIMLELLHLLADTKALPEGAVQVGRDRLATPFTWQDALLQISYNRQDERVTDELREWQNGPGVRPDYAITRQHALPALQDPAGNLIWREPPVLLDAKYYLAGSDLEHTFTHTHGPVKKLLGDMTLLNASQCLLFFPLLPEPELPGPHESRLIARQATSHHDGHALPLELRIYRIDPRMTLDELQARLRAILNHVSAHLAARPTSITCQGICLDPDSINANGQRTATDGQILCPKPHIGPHVYDLVKPSDCLQNHQRCHVIGQAIIPPYVLRVTNQHELQQQTADLRRQHEARLQQHAGQSNDEEQETQVEALHSHIFTSIGRTIEQYVTLRGNTQSIEEQLETWVFGRYWQHDPRALSPATREMLKSGEYVWQEYLQSTGLQDWAAPAIQYCRALEWELKRRFFLHAPKAFKVGGAGWTIGTPVHALRHRKTNQNARSNMQLLLSLIAPEEQRNLIRQLHRLTTVRETRNGLAHSRPLSKSEAITLRALILGSRERLGILCWLAAHGQPAP